MNVPLQPTLNAVLNLIAAILLIFGFVNIKKKKISVHKKFMLSALVVSLLFLTSYVIYHYRTGSVPYPHHNWTRFLYFSILLPHIFFAAVQTPFIILLVIRALRGNFEKHKRLARFVWPVWMFVSLSGVIIYLMLYHL
jgi:putative membrane protein